MHRTVSLAAAAAFVALAGCQSSKPQPLTSADSTAIAQVRTAFVSAWNTGNVGQVVALYSADAVLQQGDSPERDGQPAIRAYFDTAMGTPQRPKLDVVHVTTTGQQGLGVDAGAYTLTFPAAPAAASGPSTAAPGPLNGKFLVVLRQQADGSWKIAYHAGSLDAPPAPPPAPAKPARRRGR